MSSPPPPSRHPAPFVVPPVSLLSSASGLRRFLLLSLSVFSHRFLAMSLPLPSAPDHPVASTTAIPQLFSTFLALVAVAACRRISRAFRYYVLYWSFSPSLSFPLSLVCFLYCSSLSSPLLPGTPGWHQFLEPSHLPPDFCVSSHPLHFLSFSKWTSEFMRRN